MPENAHAGLLNTPTCRTIRPMHAHACPCRPLRRTPSRSSALGLWARGAARSCSQPEAGRPKHSVPQRCYHTHHKQQQQTLYYCQVITKGPETGPALRASSHRRGASGPIRCCGNTQPIALEESPIVKSSLGPSGEPPCAPRPWLCASCFLLRSPRRHYG